ncbi:MAG: histidine kinase [Solirubrobacteraceae bacterium]
MSLDPTLQVRRWFERRPVILAAAGMCFGAVAVAGAPELYVLPVMLVALELGLAGGLVVAAAAAALVVAGGALAPAVAVLAAGAVAGRFSDQMRALLEQRRGFGHLLDAQEDDRRRHAETLHEELAQVLSAVLMNLRMLRRQGVDAESLDELHDQVVGVLEEIRDLATELRPSSLAQLGLVPALEALDGVSVEAGGRPEPVPEPARTGIYRFVEHVASEARSGVYVRVSAANERLDVVIDADLRAPQTVTAARARVALLGGSLSAEPLSAGFTRLRVRLPLQAAGSVARTTVLPTAESISS